EKDNGSYQRSVCCYTHFFILTSSVMISGMKQKLIHSFYVSLEWRVIAFLVTNAFLWVTTGNFWQATALALTLQAILFVVHFGWYFVRQEQGSALHHTQG